MSDVDSISPKDQTRKPRAPAMIWTAVLALIPLLIQWLQGDAFKGEDWVLLAVALLTLAARFIEVYVAQLQEAGNAGPPQMMSMATPVVRSPLPARPVKWRSVFVEAIFG